MPELNVNLGLKSKTHPTKLRRKLTSWYKCEPPKSFLTCVPPGVLLCAFKLAVKIDENCINNPSQLTAQGGTRSGHHAGPRGRLFE